MGLPQPGHSFSCPLISPGAWPRTAGRARAGDEAQGTLGLIRRRALLPASWAIHQPNTIPGGHCSANMYTQARRWEPITRR